MKNLTLISRTITISGRQLFRLPKHITAPFAASSGPSAASQPQFCSIAVHPSSTMAFPPIIPASTSTVNVSVIDSSNWALKVPCGHLFKPKYKGLETFDLCSYSFLISNGEGDSARHVLFDLGIRKDWPNLPPPMPTRFGEWGAELKVEKHVSEVLRESHFDLRNIEAIIWRQVFYIWAFFKH
jgi:hypothetical protein